MCIHDRHYRDEYDYLSNLFDKGYISAETVCYNLKISAAKKKQQMFKKLEHKKWNNENLIFEICDG